MADLLFAAGALVLLICGAGLAALWRGEGDIDRMLAFQLLGSGAIAVLLLIAPAMSEPALLDAALLTALLAALAACAYRAALGGRTPPAPDAPERQP
ncbi:monovalent cation/H+ antiporter complex subunit F [Xanthobacter tagetidis]|uniref:Multiple resistance and pH regulation protein F n=1 Tax=Xanthobacter tagetidis TaxID=60216 RepID=A0A3L7A747_9HYPH|nr:monovalent cation/H+ antiporter complex subunit F [Xanthobacter tagetidis]MBB6310083.1 multicomponent Na+:H+ antiporter subunit F [Xanthobacter tagetidis]RLP75182.1 multiple resistance and pH regulation protein F [Xanthobacter tagetidis]